MSERCSESVFNGCHSKPCTRTIKVLREGKWFCGIHDPKVIAKKNSKRSARWKKEWEESSRRRLLEQAAPNLLEALQAIVSDEALLDLIQAIGEEPPWLEQARAAIRKALGR